MMPSFYYIFELVITAMQENIYIFLILNDLILSWGCGKLIGGVSTHRAGALGLVPSGA